MTFSIKKIFKNKDTETTEETKLTTEETTQENNEPKRKLSMTPQAAVADLVHSSYVERTLETRLRFVCLQSVIPH